MFQVSVLSRRVSVTLGWTVSGPVKANLHRASETRISGDNYLFLLALLHRS